MRNSPSRNTTARGSRSTLTEPELGTIPGSAAQVCVSDGIGRHSSNRLSRSPEASAVTPFTMNSREKETVARKPPTAGPILIPRLMPSRVTATAVFRCSGRMWEVSAASVAGRTDSATKAQMKVRPRKSSKLPARGNSNRIRPERISEPRRTANAPKRSQSRPATGAPMSPPIPNTVSDTPASAGRTPSCRVTYSTMKGTTMVPARFSRDVANTIQTDAGRPPTPRQGFVQRIRAHCSHHGRTGAPMPRLTAGRRSHPASCQVSPLTCEPLHPQPLVEFIDPVIAAGPLLPQTEAVAAGLEHMEVRLDASGDERVTEPQHRLERHRIILGPRHEDRRQLRRNRRDPAEGSAVDQSGEIGPGCAVGLEQGSAGDHRSSGETEHPNSARRDSPRCGVRPDNLKGLNPVGDAVAAGGVHVHLRNPFLLLLDYPVLEDEGSNAPLLQPAGDGSSLQVHGECHEGAARRDDDPGAGGLGAVREVGRELGSHDIEDDGPERGVLDGSLPLSPPLRAGSDAGPDVHNLGIERSGSEGESACDQQHQGLHSRTLWLRIESPRLLPLRYDPFREVQPLLRLAQLLPHLTDFEFQRLEARLKIGLPLLCRRSAPQPLRPQSQQERQRRVDAGMPRLGLSGREAHSDEVERAQGYRSGLPVLGLEGHGRSFRTTRVPAG